MKGQDMKSGAVLLMVARGVDSFCILSADNPGRVFPEFVNRSNRGALRRDIERMGYKAYECAGVWGGVREVSFIVPGMTRAVGEALGRKYGQAAIICRDGLVTTSDSVLTPRTGFQLLGDNVTDNYSDFRGWRFMVELADSPVG